MDLCRIDFALIPEEPLFSGVVNASQAITDEYYYNANIIDEKTFPPHVSMHICTVPRSAVVQVSEGMRVLAAGLPELVPTGVEEGTTGGYVMLYIELTDNLIALHEAVLELAAEAREGLGSDKYGSPYIRKLFSPHLSLAKVDDRDQVGAAAIGRNVLCPLVAAPSRSLELCDIGERSEQWEVLASYPRS